MSDTQQSTDTTEPLFTFKETIESGRGLVATRTIPKDTLILKTDDLTVSLIYHEYRKEVCAQCFAYDRGTHWRLRDSRTGFVFCSGTCFETWIEEATEVGLQAWAAVHSFVQSNRRQDENMVDQSGPRPTASDIDNEWAAAGAIGERIVAARNPSSSLVAAQDLAALRKCLAEATNVDPLHLFVTGILDAASHAHGTWAEHLALEEDGTPYRSISELQAHITSYLHLLAILPTSLLSVVTRQVLQATFDRASHNAFSLRPADDADEFLGWAVWPSASYFNHTCGPNVRKARNGRTWHFFALRDVALGEELGISYLGGLEASLDLWQQSCNLTIEKTSNRAQYKGILCIPSTLLKRAAAARWNMPGAAHDVSKSSTSSNGNSKWSTQT
ncbi:MAG: hypothetical protein M1828_005764 [Chrysothrix sp. TS-e1954]|nr:MAG: hypothetical protein M1828_005764 [Chrysothrix sp. TS-e1954]